MAVRIRMQRMGRKNRPYYRIVAIDGRSPRNGRAIENLGTYHPVETETDKVVKINDERVRYWLSVGAQPSETAASIFKKQGIELPWIAAEQARKMRAAAARRKKKGKPERDKTSRKALKKAGKSIKKDKAKKAKEAKAPVDAESKKAKRDAKKAGG